jgi:hypothetical protein
MGVKKIYNAPRKLNSVETFFSKIRKHKNTCIMEKIGTTKKIPFSPKIPMNNARKMGKIGGTSPGYPLKKYPFPLISEYPKEAYNPPS